jgi:hypothetical protein
VAIGHLVCGNSKNFEVQNYHFSEIILIISYLNQKKTKLIYFFFGKKAQFTPTSKAKVMILKMYADVVNFRGNVEAKGLPTIQ